MANKVSKGRVQLLKGKKSTVVTDGPRKCFAKQQNKQQAKNGVKKNIFSQVPVVVCVVPFHEAAVGPSFEQLVSRLVVADSNVSSHTCYRQISGHFPGHPKHALSVVVPRDRTRLDVVCDLAKVADVLLCVFPPEARHDKSCFDELGYTTLAALRFQGLPSLVVGTVVDSSGDFGVPSKLGIKTVHRYFTSEFGNNEKHFRFCPNSLQAVNSVYASLVCGGCARSSSDRGYMLVESIAVEESSGQVVISGVARGCGFSVNSAVNLTGIANPFRVAKIELERDSNRAESSMGEDGTTVLIPSESEVERMTALLEPLRPAEEQDQQWVTDEEIEMALSNPTQLKRVAVPAGASTDMEIAWLEEDQEIVDAGAEDDEALMESLVDWSKLELSKNGKDPTEDTPLTLQLRTREEMQFVDEVDTPENVPARERFQKYRGLKSLRNGLWDPLEDLPVEYSQIHVFQDFAHTAKVNVEELMKQGKDCKNKRCRIWLVPSTVDQNFTSGLPQMLAQTTVASTLGAYESKVTVVHCRITPLTTLNSKEPVVVQMGMRRIEIRPIYSEIPKYNSNHGATPIQRMLRTVEAESSVMMSFYAPATLSTGATPVLLLKGGVIAAWGSVLNANVGPNKPIIVKRITLTGYPFRVHKTRSVIRFMFFNPVDIEWFKPVELVTRKGLRGHILEPLGTHGYMKCQFNGPLTSDDVICMHLYKRTFPKFHAPAWASI